MLEFAEDDPIHKVAEGVGASNSTQHDPKAYMRQPAENTGIIVHGDNNFVVSVAPGGTVNIGT